jgi:hypothetical protein
MASSATTHRHELGAYIQKQLAEAAQASRGPPLEREGLEPGRASLTKQVADARRGDALPQQPGMDPLLQTRLHPREMTAIPT